MPIDEGFRTFAIATGGSAAADCVAARFGVDAVVLARVGAVAAGIEDAGDVLVERGVVDRLVLAERADQVALELVEQSASEGVAGFEVSVSHRSPSGVCRVRTGAHGATGRRR